MKDLKIYLYVKQHKVTKLKYFGKTYRNPYTYNGSGKYWLRHLKKHGYDIETLNVFVFDNQEECTEFALQFSRSNNIVDSKEWANLQEENGKDGSVIGKKLSEEQRKRLSDNHWSKKIIKKEDNPNFGSKRTKEQKMNISKSKKNKPIKSSKKSKELKESFSIMRKNCNMNMSSTRIQDILSLYNEIIDLYESRPNLTIKYNYIRGNGKLLTYERAFSKEYSRMFNVNERTIYNIIKEKTTIQKNYARTDEWEIETPSGFQSFQGIVKNSRETKKITFNDGMTIIVTLDHRFIENENEYIVKNLCIGDIISGKTITNIEDNGVVDVYDPVNVSNGNIYIANDIAHHNCEFLGSSSTLISGDTLSQMSPIPPIYIKENFEVLEPPVPENFYSIVCDTARGVGGDYSAFTIIDCTKYPYRVVAKFRDNNISPLLFPTIIHKVAKDYNDAHVLIEINDIGQQVADILYDELEYENVIHIDSMQKKGQFVSFSNTDAKRGIRTTKQVKSIGCAVLKSLVEEKKLLIFDSDIISELTTFVETKGSYEADEGYHDDLAMCLVLFAWLTSDPIFKDLTNTNNRKALYDKRMDNIMSGLTPFGILPDSKKQFEIEVIGDDVWFTDKHENDLENFIRSMVD